MTNSCEYTQTVLIQLSPKLLGKILSNHFKLITLISDLHGGSKNIIVTMTTTDSFQTSDFSVTVTTIQYE